MELPEGNDEAETEEQQNILNMERNRAGKAKPKPVPMPVPATAALPVTTRGVERALDTKQCMDGRTQVRSVGIEGTTVRDACPVGSEK